MVAQTKAPFASARITLIDGEQGNGKSVTGVARIVDAYYADAVGIYCRERLGISCEVKAYYRKNRVAKIKHNGELKLIQIPSNYKLYSPMQIFTNFHLYGIPHVYLQTFHQVLEGLQSGLINGGKLVVDEYYMGGNAREGMSQLGRALVKQSMQYRKMQLEVIIITPLAKLIDWTARMINTERITCTSYNERTRHVTLEIKKKGEPGSREISYDASPYFCNFWTNERINA